MTTEAQSTIRDAVRSAYGGRAREVLAGSASGAASGVAAALYAGEAANLPEGVVSYGCGNPVAIAGLQPGEVVLDLGSGAGLDCFLSGKQVGPTGRVIGLDMTEEMLALAESNRAKLAVDNVEFRHGVIEDIPLADASVDVIISNCVINLSPDKDAVFGECLRVLRPGGRFQVSDIVLRSEISEAERADLDLWSGCKSGALLIDDYTARLRRAGFEDIEVVVTGDEGDGIDQGAEAWASALINARKPGGTVARAWRLSGPMISLIAPAGLDTADCCSLDDPSCN